LSDVLERFTVHSGDGIGAMLSRAAFATEYADIYGIGVRTKWVKSTHEHDVTEMLGFHGACSDNAVEGILEIEAEILSGRSTTSMTLWWWLRRTA
jgi:hypothetical protein